MAKRLQVILQDPEYREIHKMARARRMSLAEWVRQALHMARNREPLGAAAKKLESTSELRLSTTIQQRISTLCWLK